MKKVFLGGTCNESKWRNKVIKDLKLSFFNPMQEEWTPAMMAEEIKQRAECDFCLYVLTPKMEGFFAIAEVVDDSSKRPGKTIFCFLDEDEGKTFSAVQKKSLTQVAKMVKENGAMYFENLTEVVNFLNQQ